MMSLRADVADVLMDFAAVLTEEIGVEMGASLDFEVTVMARISPIISRLRKGEDMSPGAAYCRKD